MSYDPYREATDPYYIAGIENPYSPKSPSQAPQPAPPVETSPPPDASNNSLTSPGCTQAKCPISAPPQKPCCFRSLTVRCGHGTRAYTVTLPLPKDQQHKKKLWVTAGHTNPDEIEATISGGLCNRGYSNVPEIILPDGTRKKATAKHKIYASKLSASSDWMWMLLPDKYSRQKVYTISADACEGAGGSTSLEIIACPFSYAKLTLSLNTYSLTIDKVNKVRPSGKENDSFKIDFKASYDKGSNDKANENPTACLEIESWAKAAFTVAKRFRGMSEWLRDLLLKLGSGISFDFKGPNIELEIESTILERTGSHELCYDQSARLKLNPIVEVGINCDIITTISNVWPAAGKLIKKVRDFAEDFASLELNFRVFAAPTVELSAIRNLSTGEVWKNQKPKFIFKLAFELAGASEGYFQKWVVSVSAGAGFTGEGGIEFEWSFIESDPLQTNLKIMFTGIKIEWWIYASGSVTTKPAKKGRNRDNAKEGTDATLKPKKEEIELCPPQVWHNGPLGFLQ